MRKTVAILALSALLAAGSIQAQTSDPELQEIQQLRQTIEQLQQRLDALEKQVTHNEKKQKRTEKVIMTNQRKTALDSINFSGDFRFEANGISTSVPDFYNGMTVQKGMVDTMFYMGATGTPPQSLDDVHQFIAQNYSQYQYFLSQLTFDKLKQGVGQIPP
ncbi:MAG TPA: DUF3373 family protein, partial [Acidobacteria bacterium]|nr:DUF3373 family protein [Acidobacteriota bacterium]